MKAKSAKGANKGAIRRHEGRGRFSVGSGLRGSSRGNDSACVRGVAAQSRKIFIRGEFAGRQSERNGRAAAFGGDGDFAIRQPDEIREVTGPPKSVAFDNVGAPTRAATSFAEKQGVKLRISPGAKPRAENISSRGKLFREKRRRKFWPK